MIVATATDGGYAELTGAMLASLARNAHGDYEKVLVFVDRISADDKARLLRSYGRDDIEIVEVTDADLAFLCGMPVKQYMSRITYARLFIPHKVEPADGRLLYIDCDAVVHGPLSPLRDLPLEGHVLAAVGDDAQRRPKSHANRNAAIGAPEGTPYLNAGVLLIDVAEWRRRDITGRARQFSIEHPDLPLMDQDAINGTLRGDWLKLDECWNMHCRYSKKGDYAEPPEAWRGARIVHYMGPVKPNHSDCNHPARDIYFEYRRLTPWADAPLHSALRREWKKKLGKLRRFLGRLVPSVPGARA